MESNFKIKRLILRSSIMLASTLTLGGCYKLDKSINNVTNEICIEINKNTKTDILDIKTANSNLSIEEKIEIIPTPTPPINKKLNITKKEINNYITLENEIIESEIIDERKPVSLTFDDGPSKYTLTLLDLLDEYDIKATFFVIESCCKKFPDALSEIANRGHEIAIHGSTHTSFYELTNEQINNEINSTITYIESLGITPSYLVRPPYGNINSDIIENVNYPFIKWCIDTKDYSNKNKDTISNIITSEIHEGYIILMHDNTSQLVHQADIDALNEILPDLIKEYNFVTVSKLAELSNVELETNKTYRKIKKSE